MTFLKDSAGACHLQVMADFTTDVLLDALVRIKVY